MLSAAAAFAALDDAWRASLHEAWESWREGSAGVDAAITDASGAIVARGRNRRGVAREHPGSIVGTPLAHAEMCAIAALPPGPRDGCTISTTYEPCLMCAGAIMVTGIRSVRYAAPDPLFEGMHDWFAELPYAAARLPERQVLGGPIGAFAFVLHVSWLALWVPGNVLDPHRSLAPRHLELAAGLVERSPLASIAAAGGSVVDAIDALWPELGSI